MIMFSRSVQMAVPIPKLFKDTRDHPWRERVVFFIVNSLCFIEVAW